MKKLIAIATALMLMGCNAQIIDTTWHYDYNSDFPDKIGGGA